MKILALLMGFTLFTAVFAEVPPETNRMNSQFSTVLRQVMPAVVNITVSGELPFSAALYEQQKEGLPEMGETGPKFQSVGSGVIVNAEQGYIVTNAHVVRDAKMIIVTLNDGRRLKATKIGEDTDTDIAVIQVNSKHLTAVPLAKVGSMQVGDFVAAIGNPYGLHQTVTSGVISALHRSFGIYGMKGFENFMQTDAPINPGNSGGALVNMRGELVGINTALVSPTQANVGIGFAIPVFMVQEIMQQLIESGKVKRGMLGVVVQDLTPNLADAFNMSDSSGVIVTQVTPGSAAQSAGLKPQDVIQNINGMKIYSAAQMRSIVGVLPSGTTLSLKIRRHDQNLVINTATKDPAQQLGSNSKLHFIAGVGLRNYDMFDLSVGEIKGVQVVHVGDTSDAWLAGLRPGDVIIMANGKSVRTIDALLNETAQNKQQLLLQVWRSGGISFIVIT